jgi:hypothetical protein
MDKGAFPELRGEASRPAECPAEAIVQEARDGKTTLEFA